MYQHRTSSSASRSRYRLATVTLLASAFTMAGLAPAMAAPPAAPATVTVKDNLNGTATITWPKSVNAVSYRVKVGQPPNQTYTTVLAPLTSFTTPTLGIGTTLTTRVASTGKAPSAGTSAFRFAPSITLQAPPPPPVPNVGKARIGMSAPANLWDQRVAEVGPGLEARRLFYGLGDDLKLAQQAVDAGLYPILSFKIPGNDWAGVAQGKYDTQLATLKQHLVALNAPVFVTLHHEPTTDGTPADYAAMLTHALPLLDTSLVDVGPIGNGWWWSSKANGYTDAEIAEWLTPSVLAVSEIVAGDTYQGGTPDNPGEGGSAKMLNMVKWAERNDVDALGVGEFNGYTAAEITAATSALGSSPRFKFGAVWNSQCAGCIPVSALVGDRLGAFRTALADWR